MVNKETRTKIEQLRKNVFKTEQAILNKVQQLHSVGTLPISVSLLQSDLNDAREDLAAAMLETSNK